MEMWDKRYLDLVAPAFIEFEDDQGGFFQFGTVRGGLDYRLEAGSDPPRVDFSWDGDSDGDPASGRGWAVLVSGALTGRIFIHASDDSAFTAIANPRRATATRVKVKSGNA